VLGEPFLVVTSGILAAAVGVVHQTGQRPTPLKRHVQRSQRQLLGHLLVHRPADHLAGEEVEHDGQVQPAFAGPDVAQIGQPDRVRRLDRELPIQQVGPTG
jgi:hypothetical protein